MSIKLSEQYGVNPSISVCAFCGNDKELLLLGKLKGDVKAPQRMIVDYKPCSACKEKMRQGRVIIEVVTEDNGRLPIREGTWPTGRWMVITRAAAEHIFRDNTDKPILLNEDIYKRLNTNLIGTR